MKGMHIVASATITRGAVTNRVTGFRRAKVPAHAKPARVAKSAGSAKAAYRQDPAVRGMDTAIICASLPVGELVELDAACERLRLARSHLIRLAVKAFMGRGESG